MVSLRKNGLINILNNVLMKCKSEARFLFRLLGVEVDVEEQKTYYQNNRNQWNFPTMISKLCLLQKNTYK